MWGGLEKQQISWKVFASKTIQKDQLDHTAKTGNKCRTGAKLAQRGLKATLFICFILHLNHLCTVPISRDRSTVQLWVPFDVIYSLPSLILPSVLLPQHSVTVPLTDTSQTASSSWPYNPVVAFMFSVNHTWKHHQELQKQLVCMCAGGDSKWFWVHMNNALLYCGIVNLYSYCNVNSYRFKEKF